VAICAADLDENLETVLQEVEEHLARPTLQ